MSALVSVEQMISTICQRVQRIEQREFVELEHAVGRITANSILAGFAFPTTATSAMDGYAAVSDEITIGKRFLIDQYIPAGMTAKPLVAGTVSRVFTGSPLPQGADCVIIQENATRVGECVQFSSVAKPMENVRPLGSNFRTGDKLCAANTVLSESHIGLLAMAGIARVEVIRQPTACVFTLGDELVAVGKKLPEGKIYDSNSVLVTSLLRRYGCVVVHNRLGDNSESIAQSLLQAQTSADIIITCGGASVGERDFVPQVIGNIGEIHRWKVNIKPGKPFLFGSVGVPFFGLPGNPASALMNTLLFVRPAICTLQGLPTAVNPYSLPLLEEYINTSSRVQYVWCTRDDNGVRVSGKQVSASLAACTEADGIFRIAGKTTLSATSLVSFFSLNDLQTLG